MKTNLLIEERNNIKVNRIRLMCKNCNIEMVQDCFVYMTDPPQYKYICPKCGYSEMDFQRYPHIELVINDYNNEEKPWIITV